MGNSIRNTARALAALCLSLGVVAACGDDTSSTSGTSGDVCPGQTKCGDVCADVQNDPDNCGGCGTACGAGEACIAGSCSAGACSSNTTDCGGLCVDTQIDPVNCGACGTVCGQGEVCSAGSCGSSCGGGTTDCSGVCVNTDSDNANCGSCANACPGGEVCDGTGTCAASCQSSLVNCNNTCVDPQSDESFCGATGDCQGGNAGTACATGELCDAGNCTLSCQSGFIDCSSTCIDPQTNDDFCGATGDCAGGNVGVACAPGQTCSAGTCTTFASCQAIKTAGGDRGDGVYTIDRGDGPISVYCDMTAGRTYVSFAAGDYNNSYSGYVNASLASWLTVPFQQAFIWFYNTHDGLQNLQVGWTGGNCCIYLTNNQALHWGTTVTTRLFDLNGGQLCSNSSGWNLGRYHVGKSGTYAGPPLPANYFVTNPPTSGTACSADNNPGIFVQSFI